MELVARKADLVRELQFFQQIVERKNTIPILANVLIEGSGNEVTLLAMVVRRWYRPPSSSPLRTSSRSSGPVFPVAASSRL